ncbi:DUF202 domain-containing protein [Ancylothrix sp. C2]|uniref:YidH family protein n=1 Tax=Ancylothrix sp. D3o TaxID=2953691 RepID=UPI0021BAD7C8|nr:DUF202 domain-containing protein [Ancylothrix sp. D3o]MCT7952445.1 DUF202 domain-containing protein [Ancylothrix sp. D3o]
MSNNEEIGRKKVDRQQQHQANERTFLAWLRTSIALIGFGFATARFGLFLRQLQASVTGESLPDRSFLSSQTLGVGLVVVGVSLIALGALRYNQVFWQIERDDYRPNRLFVWVTACFVMVLGLLSVPLLLLRESGRPVRKGGDVGSKVFRGAGFDGVNKARK